jgi:hypothetical protein
MSDVNISYLEAKYYKKKYKRKKEKIKEEEEGAFECLSGSPTVSFYKFIFFYIILKKISESGNSKLRYKCGEN